MHWHQIAIHGPPFFCVAACKRIHMPVDTWPAVVYVYRGGPQGLDRSAAFREFFTHFKARELKNFNTYTSPKEIARRAAEHEAQRQRAREEQEAQRQRARNAKWERGFVQTQNDPKVQERKLDDLSRRPDLESFDPLDQYGTFIGE